MSDGAATGQRRSKREDLAVRSRPRGRKRKSKEAQVEAAGESNSKTRQTVRCEQRWCVRYGSGQVVWQPGAERYRPNLLREFNRRVPTESGREAVEITGFDSTHTTSEHAITSLMPVSRGHLSAVLDGQQHHRERTGFEPPTTRDSLLAGALLRRRGSVHLGPDGVPFRKVCHFSRTCSRASNLVP